MEIIFELVFEQIFKFDLVKMCGSLLSKFEGPNNAVEPEKNTLGDLKCVKSTKEDATGDKIYFEDRDLWKAADSMSDQRQGKTSRNSNEELLEEKTNELNPEKPVLPAINSRENTKPIVARNQEHLLESAREILGVRANDECSSFNTDAVHPLSSVCSNLPDIKTAVAFDIPASGERTVYPPSRVPRRLRKSRKVVPEINLLDMKEKLRAAEERKLKELEKIRGRARSRVGITRPHRADVCAQVTKEKIAAKQIAAEKKRIEEISKRKEGGKKASKGRNRIAEAKAFAKSQLESTIGRKLEETQQRKEKKQKTVDKQKKLKDKYAKKVKERVSINT